MGVNNIVSLSLEIAPNSGQRSHWPGVVLPRTEDKVSAGPVCYNPVRAAPLPSPLPTMLLLLLLPVLAALLAPAASFTILEAKQEGGAGSGDTALLLCRADTDWEFCRWAHLSTNRGCSLEWKLAKVRTLKQQKGIFSIQRKHKHYVYVLCFTAKNKLLAFSLIVGFGFESLAGWRV